MPAYRSPSLAAAESGGVRPPGVTPLTPDGVRVEVKSAAYVQSWAQAKLSRISFSHARRRGFDTVTGVEDPEPGHHANVGVFALLAHLDKAPVDLRDTNQWQFFVVPTANLAARTRSQHSITLSSLTGELQCPALTWSELRDAVSEASTPPA